MQVSQLITELQKFHPEMEVHLDVSSSEYIGFTKDGSGWEGDRVVRHVERVREQSGFFAVAIDAASWEDTESRGFVSEPRLDNPVTD